jgi:hypothetical protein
MIAAASDVTADGAPPPDDHELLNDFAEALVTASAGTGCGSARSVLVLAAQVRDSMGPLKLWPAGHLIMALSRGPSVERMLNRYLTSAGNPDRTEPFLAR